MHKLSVSYSCTNHNNNDHSKHYNFQCPPNNQVPFINVQFTYAFPYQFYFCALHRHLLERIKLLPTSDTDETSMAVYSNTACACSLTLKLVLWLTHQVLSNDSHSPTSNIPGPARRYFFLLLR